MFFPSFQQEPLKRKFTSSHNLARMAAIAKKFNKDKLTREGFEPTTNRLMCRVLYQLSYLAGAEGSKSTGNAVMAV